MAKQPKFKTAIQIAAETAEKEKARQSKRTADAQAAAPANAQQAFQEKLAAAKAIRETKTQAYIQQLASGQVSGLMADRTHPQDLTEARYPEAVHYNPAFHDELGAHIAEVNGRISSLTLPTKATRTNKDGSTTEYYRDADKKLMDVVNAARHHLNLASQAHQNSYGAHLAGGATEAHPEGRPAAITAVADFSRSADHLHDAINTLNAGLKSGNKDLVSSDLYEKGYAPLGGDLPFRLSTLVRAYTGSVAGSVGDEIGDKVRDLGSRSYQRGQDSPSFTAPPAPGGYRAPAVGTGQPKPASYAPAIGKRQLTVMQKAKELGVGHIPEAVKNLYDEYDRNAVKEEAERTANPIEVPIPPRGTEPVAYNPGEGAPTTSMTLRGEPVTPFRVRWARDSIRNDWSSKNPDKTFVGSDAYNDPEGWHLKDAVKTHYLQNGGTEENYEGSIAEQDPKGYREAWSDPSLGAKRFQYRELLDSRFPDVARRRNLFGAKDMPSTSQSIEAERTGEQEHPEVRANQAAADFRKSEEYAGMTDKERQAWEDKNSEEKNEKAYSAEGSTEQAAEYKKDMAEAKDNIKKMGGLGDVIQEEGSASGSFGTTSEPAPKFRGVIGSPDDAETGLDQGLSTGEKTLSDSEDMSAESPSEKLAKSGESMGRNAHFSDAAESAISQKDSKLSGQEE